MLIALSALHTVVPGGARDHVQRIAKEESVASRHSSAGFGRDRESPQDRPGERVLDGLAFVGVLAAPDV
jgi:hypothetical protein